MLHALYDGLLLAGIWNHCSWRWYCFICTVCVNLWLDVTAGQFAENETNEINFREIP